MTQRLLSLTTAHAQQLASSAISDTVIVQRGYRSIPPGAAAEVIALAGSAFSSARLHTVLHQGALAIPIYRLSEPQPYTTVLRPDLPRADPNGKPIKYEWPRGLSNVFDALPLYAAALRDPSITLWITEGAKKSDALASAYGTAIMPLNENGVWGWRGKNSMGGTTALADLELIAWENRTVILAPDGDVRYNKDVLSAVQRLARLLLARWKPREIYILELPQAANGPKIGVDDYLAAGHTTQELESHLRSLGSVMSAARVPLCTHPETGAKLFLPAGYDVQHQTIVRLDRNGSAQHVYSGLIYIEETGVDLHTHEQSALVAWNGRGNVHETITVPYAALSDSKLFSNHVGAAGAAVHPRNIKDVQRLLVEFIQENIDTLPRRAHVDRLGLVNGGVVLPAGAVGFAEELRYSGRPAITVGTDADAYPAALRQALTWPGAWPLWLTLSLSLSGPAIARLRPRRNPVLYLSGPSGSGKTTVAQFAVGSWGNPMRLRIEAGRTTPAGIFQTFEHLNGLPAFIDEAHTIPDQRRLEMACYSFANGQRYTIGGPDQKARGGSDLYGALLLAGEAVPEFRHAGANLRVLWVDAGIWLPMGAEPRSADGQTRAMLLEAAWGAGAGLFGKAVTEVMWRDWTAFTESVRVAEQDRALAPLQAWRTPLAIAAAVLDVVLSIIDARTAAPNFDGMLDRWVEMLTSGHSDVDPAIDTWEALVTMLAQGRRGDDGYKDANGVPVPPQWEYIEADRGGGVVACRKAGESYWRVLSTTPQFKERLGAACVQLYGQTWLKRGWVLPGKDGKSTEYKTIYPSGALRVLKVPTDMLEQWIP